MKRVGVREFRDHATQLLAGNEVLAIERHGQPIGFYIPTATGRRESFAHALEQLQQTIEQIMGETGLSEDQVSRLFDLNEPVPQHPRARDTKVVVDPHASDR